MQKSFCLNCKREVSSKVKKCKCGNKGFAFGEKLQVVNGHIQCSCGSDQIKTGSHMDYSDKYVTSGVCAGCGAGVGIEKYRDKEIMMYWGWDEDFDMDDKYQKRVENRQKLYEKKKALGKRL